MASLNKEVLKAVGDITDHIEAIKEIAAGMSDPALTYSLKMMVAHSMLELPPDDPLAYQALEKVYFHFHDMEGKDYGKNEHKSSK